MNFPPLDVDQWHRQAPHLREQFQNLMFGPVPKPERLQPETVDLLEETDTFRLLLRTFVTANDRRIDLLHAVPQGPIRGTFLGVNFSGNHTTVDHPDVPLPREWTYPDGDLWPVSRGGHRERWCIDEVTDAGYGLATLCHSDIVPDEPNLAPPILKALGTEGAIAAWAWGLLSVAESLDDPGPITFVGHSRMGKAALLAGAIGPKATGHGGVACIQSGCGGSAPSRTTVGETVGQITTAFPHWFSPTFATYAGREDELPFDQHALLALCAPNPVLLLNAEDDEWANPTGQEAMAELARPIFASLGVENAIQTFRRPGGHSVTREDWVAILSSFT